MIYLGSKLGETEVENRIQEVQESLINKLYLYFTYEESKQGIFYLESMFLCPSDAGVQVIKLGGNECRFRFLREGGNYLLVVYLSKVSDCNAEYCGIATSHNDKLWEIINEYLERYYALKIFSARTPLTAVYQRAMDSLGENPLEEAVFNIVLDNVICQELEK